VRQLELGLWPPTVLRGAIAAFMREHTKAITPATVQDYTERGEWLELVLDGPATPLKAITIMRLQKVKQRWGSDGEGLKDVTLRKRLRFLVQVMGHAVAEGTLSPMDIPDLKWLKLRDDSERGDTFHTVDQFWRMHANIKKPRYRQAHMLLFWTGMHPYDLRRTKWTEYEPDYVWTDDKGTEIGHGRYWRLNHKNKRCQPAWVPMEPEFRQLMKEHMAARTGAHAQWENATVVGKIFNLHREFAQACDAARVPRVGPNDLRRSFATMLVARGWDYEYVRQLMGHEGEMHAKQKEGSIKVETSKPSTLTRHYLRPSGELFTRALKDHR
jgi:integrase